MNAPLETSDFTAAPCPVKEYKEELVCVMQHALAAIEIASPWGTEHEEFHGTFYETKREAFHFVSEVLDLLIGVPAYVMRQHQIVTDNLYAASNCVEIMLDQNASAEDREKAREYLRIQADTIYFSLNNCSGKLLTLHGNLLYHKDNLAGPALRLREIAEEMQHTEDGSVDAQKLHKVEARRQHLAALMRAASWQMIETHEVVDGPFRLANVEIAEDVTWREVPMIAVAAAAGEGALALDDELTTECKAKLKSLYADLNDAEKGVCFAQAAAAAFSGLAMHGRDIIAQRLQIGDTIEKSCKLMDLALEQCALTQTALKDGHYEDANKSLLALANDWKDASDLMKDLAIDISYVSSNPLEVGMSRADIEGMLKHVMIAHAAAG